MTGREPHRLCCTCFRQYVPPGAYKCDDCQLAHTANATPPRTPQSRTNPEGTAQS